MAASLDDALQSLTAAGDDEAFIIGGAELYREALPRADRLYLTRVRADVEGDTSFPDRTNGTSGNSLQAKTHDADDKNDYALFSFEVLSNAT